MLTMRFLGGLVLVLSLILAAWIGRAAATPASPPTGAARNLKVQSLMDRDPAASYQFGGQVGRYVEALSRQWLKVAVQKNPRLLDDIKNRNQKPYRALEPWAGEFMGKHLTSAVEIYRITRDPELKTMIDEWVGALASFQGPNGYLGVFPDAWQMTGKQPEGKDAITCDAWNHYHLMLGLISWHRETGDAKALATARRIGDMMCGLYLGHPGKFYTVPPREYNFGLAHGMALLYEDTGEKRYLELAKQIVDQEYSTGESGDKNPEMRRGMDFINRALEGQEYYQNKFPAGPRWECMHSLLGVGELYWITGEAKYAKALEHIWWSMAKTDRHNNGGWGSMEQAFGSPYEVRPMELCCGVAWTALGIDVMRLTGNPVAADELELTFMNFIQGYQARSGDWVAYNVPADGKITPAMPPNNYICCCTVNGPRGFGLLTDWALQREPNGLVLNWYGPSKLTAHVKGRAVEISQQTDYPRTGEVRLTVNPERPGKFALKLRIPHWSRKTTVSVNGQPVEGIEPGRYLALERTWKKGDTIELHLDMALRLWAGENESAGRASFYRGPVLLALPRQKPETYLKYTGQWGIYNSARHLPYVDLYGSEKPGASVAFDFEGTRVAWLYNKFENCGKAEVKIDGQKKAVVDLYDPINFNTFEALFTYAWDKPNMFLSARWEQTGLAPGKHRLEITVLPEKNEKSKGHWITVRELLAETDDPVFDVKALNARLKPANKSGLPAVELDVTDSQGRAFTLRDFDSATEDCVPYISWLKVTGLAKTPFSRQNPTRGTFIE